MFSENNGKMYYVNAYYDVTDDNNYLQFPWYGASSMIYVINDEQ